MRRVLPSGGRALLVEVESAAEAHGLAGYLREHAADVVEDVVPAARTVLVVVREPRALPAMLAVVDAAPAGAAPPAQPDEVVIQVDYDGADLAEVARLTGLSVEAVVRRHREARYVVEFVGFAPGFAYLTGLDPVLQLPRLDSPRPSVPAGSIAIAGPYTAVYPRFSPGGWRLLGRTEAVLFDVERHPPTPLTAGTVVRFEQR